MNKQIHRDEFRLRILTTNQCNQNCSYCLNDFQPKEPKLYIDSDKAISVIREYIRFMKIIQQTSIITFSGGEPGIHPDLKRMVIEASQADIVKIVTNGTAYRKDLDEYVTDWHIGLNILDKKQQSIYYFAPHKTTIQIVVTDETPFDILSSVVQIYNGETILEHLKMKKVKLFTDFYSKNTERLNQMISQLPVESRFTGIQKNRGQVCLHCTKKCVTLKALWMFPDNTVSTCPQGQRPKTEFSKQVLSQAHLGHLPERLDKSRSKRG